MKHKMTIQLKMVSSLNKNRHTSKFTLKSLLIANFTTTSRKSIWTEQKFETTTVGSEEEGVLCIAMSEEEAIEEGEEVYSQDQELELDDPTVFEDKEDSLTTVGDIAEEDMDLDFVEEDFDKWMIPVPTKAYITKTSAIKQIYTKRFFCTKVSSLKISNELGSQSDRKQRNNPTVYGDEVTDALIKQAFMSDTSINTNSKTRIHHNKNVKSNPAPKRIYKDSDPEVIESRKVFAELLATPMTKREFILALLRWDGPEPAIYNPEYNKTVEPERDEHGYLIELSLEEREEYKREEERILGSSENQDDVSSALGEGTIEDLAKKMSNIPRKYFTVVLENQIMRKGKRSTAYSICKNVLGLLRSGYNVTNPYIQIEDSLKDLLPLLVPRQMGSAKSAKKKMDVQFIDERRSSFLASDWIVDAAKKSSHKGYRRMSVNLCSEIQNVWLGKETSMSKKRDSYYKEVWTMYNFIEDVSNSLALPDSSTNTTKLSKRLQSINKKTSKKVS
jgi:ribosomal protein S7